MSYELDPSVRRGFGDSRIQTSVLEGLSSAVNYRRWICDLAAPWMGDDPLELGAGNGDYASEWSSSGRQVTTSEAEPARLEELRQRFAHDPRVTVRQLALPSTEAGGYSATVAINVLEHIEDDLAALVGMRSLVRPGGHVILFVPAFPMAMSRFDREVGHFRRYRVRDLGRRMEAAGLAVQQLHYVNAPGLLAWLLLMRLGRQRPGEGFPLRVFERLVPLLRQVEGRWRPPFGQSVFAVGRRPADADTRDEGLPVAVRSE